MVGSRHGWREAAYVKCPASPSDVASRLTEVEADGRRVHLAPGLSFADKSGGDVMRGEETEIFGVADAGARLIVLPGSHSKWARVEGDRVVAFKTFVTGELFAACGTIRSPAPSPEPRLPRVQERRSRLEFCAARRRGLAKGSPACSACCLARDLCHSWALFRRDDAGEYLSGLLIGAEIEEGRRLYPGEEPYVAGAEALVERYLAAFDALGVAPTRRRRGPQRAGSFASLATGGSCDASACSDPARRHPARRHAGRGRFDRRSHCRSGFRRYRGTAQFARSPREHRTHCAAVRRQGVGGRGHGARTARGRRSRGGGRETRGRAQC